MSRILPASRGAVAVGFVAAAVLGLIVAACGGDAESDAADTTPASTATSSASPAEPGELGPYQGVQVTPPIPKPGFVLTDTDGNDFDLVADTEGSITLLYLGYTHCPDVCPTHMLDIAKSLDQLPADVVARIKVVFVSVDPKRDTPDVIRQWLDAFDPTFIGATADQETVDALQRSVGIIPATTEDLGDGNYAVNHAAYVMAYTPDNLAHLIYPFGFEREAWVHDLEKLVVDGWTES